MRCTLRVVAAVAGCVVAVSTAQGQSKVMPFLGAGAVLPMGDFGTYGKTGYMGYAGVNIPTSNSKVAVGLYAFYGHVAHEGAYGQATNIPGAAGEVQYNVSTSGSVQPYVSVGATVLQHRFDAGSQSGAGSESETKVGATLGGGLTFTGGSSTGFYVDAHYFGVSDTSFLIASAGVIFNIPKASALRLPGMRR